MEHFIKEFILTGKNFKW